MLTLAGGPASFGTVDARSPAWLVPALILVSLFKFPQTPQASGRGHGHFGVCGCGPFLGAKLTRDLGIATTGRQLTVYPIINYLEQPQTAAISELTPYRSALDCRRGSLVAYRPSFS